MVNSNYAVLKDGITINIVRWDGDTDKWQPEAGTTVVILDPAVHVIPVPIEQTNAQSIHNKVSAALTANTADITQDDTIVTQANLLIATTGTLTAAQLSNHVRSLAQAVKTLAQNDINTKKELNALIHLITNQFADTDGT